MLHNTRSTQQQIRSWTTQCVSYRNFDADQKRGMYNLEPEHQRHNVHDHHWQQDIITSSLEFGCIPAPIFHQRTIPNGTIQWESLDGKQRCNAILRFMRNELAVEFENWTEYDGEVMLFQLQPHHQQIIENLTIDFKLLHETLNDDEIRRFFQCAQQTKITTNGEHLNSDLSSPKRKAVTDLLVTTSPFTEIMKKIQPTNTRFNHLEIAAELLHCFDACVYGRETFDVTPQILKQWWKEGGMVIREPMWKDFVSSAICVMTCLDEASIKNKMSKTTFLPVYKFILERCWEFKFKDMEKEQNADRKANMKALRCVLKSGRHFRGSASSGSKQRYLTLSSIVEEELACAQSS